MTVAHQHHKHRKTVTIESFILDKFEDEKLISRLVEILEFGNTSLKISSLEIIAKVASSKSKCLVIELVGIKLLEVLLKLLDRNDEPRLVAAGTKAMATLLEQSRVGRTFIYVSSGTNKIQNVMEKVLTNYRVKPTITYDANAPGKIASEKKRYSLFFRFRPRKCSSMLGDNTIDRIQTAIVEKCVQRPF